MPKAHVIKREVNAVRCIKCDGEVGTIDHLMDAVSIKLGWYCNDCGVRNNFTLEKGEVTTIALDDPPEYSFESTLLIELVGSTPRCLFVANSFFTTNDENARVTLEDIYNSKYWVNTHTCPINWLGVKRVCVGEDEDPHGAFRFLSAWGPGDLDPTDDGEESLVGEDEYYGLDGDDLLITLYKEMEEKTAKVREIVWDAHSDVETVKAELNEWVAAYGANPRAWFLMAKEDQTEDNGGVQCVSEFLGVYTLLAQGWIITYNSHSHELTVM